MLSISARLLKRFLKKYFKSDNIKSYFYSDDPEDGFDEDEINDYVKLRILDDIIEKEPEFTSKYSDSKSYESIVIAFENAVNFKKSKKKGENKLYNYNTKDMLRAVQIFISFMVGDYPEKCKDIEELLFDIAFTPSSDGSPSTQIFSVYLRHDDFLFGRSKYYNLKSSTGSGKTRCSPFFFAIRAILEKMKYPYFVMTQPSFSVIRDKIEDFKTILGDTVTLIYNYDDLIREYRKKAKKPVIALLTPHNALKLVVKAEKNEIKVIEQTRFCLDEVHERTVDTDVLIAKLASLTLNKKVRFNVLMMTATPDQRIFNCFGKVKQINLPDSTLFHIDDYIFKAPKNEILKIVNRETVNIIKKMANGEFEPGHILIFTSGNQRMNEIINHLANIKNECTKCKRKVKVISKMDPYFASREKFYDRIRKLDLDPSSLYILPIKYAGFVSEEQKLIGKNVITGHKNIIKVIVATNAIESSVTIDELAAVVDSGLYNRAKYVGDKGITVITEKQITKKSQIQRRGRVGRVREGISVQISIEGKEIPENAKPEILTADICANILSLRMIGVELEKIPNLPNKIEEDKMKEFIRTLKKFDALDRRSKITDIGYNIGKFQTISPFIASAILLEDSKLVQLVSALAVFIFTANDLVDANNLLSEAFQNNFCEESDIVTILRTIIDVGISKEQKLNAFNAGLKYKRAINIIGDIKQIAENINYEGDVFQDMKNNFSERKLLRIVQKLIIRIGKNSPEWIKCRQCKYSTTERVLENPSFLYSGSDLLSFDDDTEGLIKLDLRPGGKGLEAPGNAFILHINHNMDMKKNYGLYIHKDRSNKDETPHPISIMADRKINTDFTIPLIDAYIGEDETNFVKFNRYSANTGTKGGNITCYVNDFKEKAIISFVPLNDKGIRLMSNAVKYIEKIIQFVPSSIAVFNKLLKCVVVINSQGINSYDAELINLDTEETGYHTYPLNRLTIRHLSHHIDKLNNPEKTFQIAMTGEMLSYGLNGEIYEQNRTIFPIVNYRCIFSNDTYFQSNMFILSKTAFLVSEGKRMEEIPWTIKGIYKGFTNSDIIARAGSAKYRNFLKVENGGKMIVLRNRNSKINIYGEKIDFTGIQDNGFFNFLSYSRRGRIDGTNEMIPLSKVFDYFSMKHTDYDHLISKINYNGFRYDGDISPFFSIINYRSTTDKIDNPIKIETIISNINEINNAIKFKIINKNGRFDAQELMVNQMLRNSGIYSIDDVKNTLTGYFQNARTSFHGKGCCVIEVNDDPDFQDNFNRFLKVAKRIDSDIIEDVVPLYNVIISHIKGDGLDKEEFVNKIKNITDRYGKIILNIPKYYEGKGNILGTVMLKVCSCEFVHPIVCEIGEMLQGVGTSQFLFPNNMAIDMGIFRRKAACSAMENWFDANDFNIKAKGTRFFGPKQDVENARKLMLKSKPYLPFKTIIISGGLNIDIIGKNVIRENRRLGFENKILICKHLRLLTIPEDDPEEFDDEELIKRLLDDKTKHDDDEDEEEILGDYISYCGAEAVLSRKQIFIYDKDGKYEAKNFCVKCLFELLKDALNTEKGGMYNELENDIIMENVLGNVLRIKPIELTAEFDDKSVAKDNKYTNFGQLAWALVNEPLLANAVRAYVTAIAEFKLHKSPLFTYCPDHPNIVIQRPPEGTKCKCPNSSCKNILCPECSKWHEEGHCGAKTSVPPGYRICPNCKCIIEKTVACNHMHCEACGKHFCYYCEAGPWDTSGPCYKHLNEEHGGFYKDPPDYRKYCKGENVPAKKLVAFYRKYPQFQNGDRKI